MSTSKRTKSQNELKVIASVDLMNYYNTQVVPLANKFKPMGEGKNTGLCPFHHDTDPSFHHWKSKNVFHCFGCGFGGDVVKTHIRLRNDYYNEKISIDTAVKDLASIFSIELDEDTGFYVPSPFERARKLILQKDTYIIPKGTMSLVEFKQLNKKVRSSNYPMNVKIQNFEHLDAVASLNLSQK